jgi:hypothetical protein
MPNTELRALFTSLSDEELIERAGSDGLTEEAQAVIAAFERGDFALEENFNSSNENTP